MFKFFTKGISEDDNNYAITEFSSFDYVKRRYLEQMNTVKEYYFHSDRAMRSNHILAKLINMLTPANDDDIYSYLNIVSANAQPISKQFGITSNSHTGEAHRNIFYLENSIELFIYTERPFSILNLNTTWKDLRPIKCIYSEETDIDFYIMNETKALSTPKLFVYEIDLVMLLMQYREWCFLRRSMDKATSPSVFIYTKVLPDIMETMFDFAIYNRYMAMYYLEEIPKFKRIHPFSILDLTGELDDVLAFIHKRTDGTNIAIPKLLTTIPGVVNKNMLELLKIPYVYMTTQSMWVYWLSRIFIIENMLDLVYEKAKAVNSDILTPLKYEIKSIERRSTKLDRELPEEIANNYALTIENIKKIIGLRY